MIYDQRLKCNYINLYYDTYSHTGVIHLPINNFCDKSGCIALFEGIDPAVRGIQVYVGNIRDVTYRRLAPNSYWHTFLPGVEV